MLEDLKSKYDKSKQHSSQQEISNNHSQKSIDKQYLLDFQNKVKCFEEQRKANQMKITYLEQEKCPFQPEINQKSKEIAKGSSKSRLLAHTPNKNQHLSCKPDRFSKSPALKEVTTYISRKNSESEKSIQESFISHQVQSIGKKQRTRSKTPTSLSKPEEVFRFHPVINKRSQELVLKQMRSVSNHAVDEDQASIFNTNESQFEPRWKMLY